MMTYQSWLRRNRDLTESPTQLQIPEQLKELLFAWPIGPQRHGGVGSAIFEVCRSNPVDEDNLQFRTQEICKPLYNVQALAVSLLVPVDQLCKGSELQEGNGELNNFLGLI